MTKLLSRCMAAALFLGVSVNMAFGAVAWPPGTGGAFPDTLGLYDVQHGLAFPGVGTPALADTIYGLGGIVTGFDAIPTGFAFYIQNRSGNAFTGIDVFTGSFNFKSSPFNVALGDSIIVNGTLTEFGGGTEIQGYDGSQGTQDLPFRIISHGNALPPFFVGTTTQLKELPTNTFAEQYEGMLVRVNGSGSNLKVARTSLTGGLGTNNSFLCVNSTAGSDSVFVDGNTLTSFSPPPVGTVLNFVQGILDQRTRGYRIQLRDGNDIQAATPPGVTDAYPVADNKIRVVFDRDVTPASATTATNYTLSSTFGPANSAIMDGTSAAIVTITNGLAHGDLETININGIVGLANGLAMTTAVPKTFYNGVLSCAEVQAPNPDSVAAAFPNCVDRSRFAGAAGQISQGLLGTRMSMTGVTAGDFTPLTYLADEPVAPRGGVSVFAPPIPLVEGRRYLVAGAVQEFFGETEVSGLVYQVDLGTAPTAPVSPISIHTAVMDTCSPNPLLIDGEDYEGMLVKLSYVKKVRRIFADGTGNHPTNGFHVNGPLGAVTDTIFIQNLNNQLGAFDTTNVNYGTFGHVYDITGVLHYTGNSFRVCPRDKAEIIDHGAITGVPQTPGKLSFSVYPNPARRTTIAFTLPAPMPVDLGIYDVSGRQVLSVIKGNLPAGSYSRAWSGKDGNGTQLNAGVYFARLKAGNETRTLRTILVSR